METTPTIEDRDSSIVDVVPKMARVALQRMRQSLDLGSVILLVAIGIAACNFIDWSQISTLDFGVTVKFWRPLATAAGMTVAITAAALACGLVIGVLLAILLELPIGFFRYVLITYIEIWRNTPLIVQLFWVHFGVPVLTGISTTALESGLLALTLQSSAYLTDVARAGIQAVPRGQWDAAMALSLPARTKWLEVILPQALKIMIPPLGNLAVSFLNGSALLGVLNVGELMTVSARISDYTSKPIEIMTVVASLYLAINVATTYLTSRLERFVGVPR
ncbi:amino acid ABC transporter permease [Bradyrhizobium canariense]|uniref:Polar amino acid transport system permease protein n=1 Tax=Bradyrhizobium canariense TaxID=255045 RepID=A0A1H1XM01_9BRAD|nr:amino acid ABC transporter permease [Bradyrhizobium canariense]SDT10257.1 polar amino acid transport system permease protein [Bradyrhizobium canariense]